MTLPQNGIHRTHTVATSSVVGSMARADHLGKRPIRLVLVPALIIGPVLIALVEWHSAGTSVELADIALPVVVGAVVLAILAVIVLRATASWHWRRTLPEDTPIFADFGSEWIGVGWQDTYTAVAVSQITQVRRFGAALNVSGGGTSLVIPVDLVPEPIAADLLRRFGRRRAPTSGTPPTRVLPSPRPTASSPDVDGTIRTQTVADEGLAARLSATMRRIPSTRLALLVTLLALMLTMVFLLDGMQTSTDWLITGMTVAAIVVILGHVLWFGGASRFRSLVPAGTTIFAEFGADWITVGLGGLVESAPVERICSVRRVDAALMLRLDNPSGALIIPVELVPLHVRNQLLRRFR